jgi:dihydropteroate synthase
MGVVNVTPDSFSDGGLWFDPEAAVAHGLRLVGEGADILDIGGESTRPGAQALDPAEELRRVLPVIEGLRARTSAPISIDTRRVAVARAALAAGASIWNDISALTACAEALPAAAELGATLVLMHMRGEPATMQDEARYDDVASEVFTYLAERAEAAQRAGVERTRIWLDPGLGFAKTAEHNLTLLRRLPELASLGFPVLVGASRKAFVRHVDPSARNAGDRLGGSIAAALAAAAGGASVIRVHDVRETIQALSMQAAIRSAT